MSEEKAFFQVFIHFSFWTAPAPARAKISDGEPAEDALLPGQSVVFPILEQLHMAAVIAAQDHEPPRFKDRSLREDVIDTIEAVPAEVDRRRANVLDLDELRVASGLDSMVIGERVIVTAIVFLFLGGILALLMRLQLARPQSTLIGPDRYNQLFSTHGTTMMFLFAVPVMEGFGIYFVPLMVGTRNVAFPKLNAFGYYVYLPSMVLDHDLDHAGSRAMLDRDKNYLEYGVYAKYRHKIRKAAQ